MTAVWEWNDHPTWFRLSSELRPIAAEVAQRDDLVLTLGLREETTTAGGFNDDQGEVWLDAHLLLDSGSDPRRLDFTRAAVRAANGPLIGELMLCAGLAAHGLRPTAPDPAAQRWADVLDAVRTAKLLITGRPRLRTWLRAASEVSCPLPGGVDAPAIGRFVWWIGQTRAGVFLPGEAARISGRLTLIIGVEGMIALHRILDTALDLGPDDHDTLVDLAVALSRMLDDDTGPGQLAEDPEAEEVVREETTSIREQAQLVLAPPPPEHSEVREQAREHRELADAAARRVFHRSTPPADQLHEPSPDLRRAARTLAGTLRRARTRVPQIIHAPSPLPPGRSRLSELMRRDAQIAARTQITAQPWLRAKRQIPPEPRLRLGISWDISRSREAVHAEWCEVAWALSWAARRVDGDVAAVAWNNRLTPIIAPGVLPTLVHQPPSAGGSSGAPESLLALAGALQLTTGAGVRILVLASDGRLPNRRHLQAEISELAATGVHILWTPTSATAWRPRDADTLITPPGEILTTLTQLLSRALQAA